MLDRFRPIERSMETVFNIITSKVGERNKESINSILARYKNKTSEDFDDAKQTLHSFTSEIVSVYKTEVNTVNLKLDPEDIIKIQANAVTVWREVFIKSKNVNNAYMGAYSYIIFNLHHALVNTNWGIENVDSYIEDYSSKVGILARIKRTFKYVRNVLFSNTSRINFTAVSILMSIGIGMGLAWITSGYMYDHTTRKGIRRANMIKDYEEAKKILTPKLDKFAEEFEKVIPADDPIKDKTIGYADMLTSQLNNFAKEFPEKAAGLTNDVMAQLVPPRYGDPGAKYHYIKTYKNIFEIIDLAYKKEILVR